MAFFSKLLFVLVLGVLSLPGTAAAQGALQEMLAGMSDATSSEHAAVDTTVATSVSAVATTAPVPSTRLEPVLHFFFSPTCPHCHNEHKWLDKMEEKYPRMDVRRYDGNKEENHQLMRDIAAEHGATQFLGIVPLTFVHGEYIIGYQDEDTSGATIEAAIRAALGDEADAGPVVAYPEDTETSSTVIPVPFVGTVDSADYSLSMLAIVLGFLDGFNVCSLGALVLIIGLTLKLQRRRAIIFFGGTFILTTALVYGALIVVWYQIFGAFSAYVDLMKIAVALLSLGGGLYFLKEYLKMHKQGAVCELQESTLIQKMMERTNHAFAHPTKLFSLLGAVLAFAVVITVVEFPCSAAVPVVFAGILAEAGLSSLAYLSHIALFVVFYMLDELIIFAIAAYKLKLWMTNGTFTKWAVLGEALVLIAIGVFYLGAIFGVFN